MASSKIRNEKIVRRELRRFVLVKSKPLEIGSDDDEIQAAASDNLYELETFHRRDDNHESLYVVNREVSVPGVEVVDKEPQAVSKTQFLPFHVIYAPDMFTAIELFEEDSGKRIWLPFGDREETQIGIERSAKEMSVVMIKKISKSAILKASDETQY